MTVQSANEGATRPVPRPRTSRSIAQAGGGVWTPLLLPTGIAAWAYGVSAIHLSSVGQYGLLAAVNVWFFLGVGLVVVGFGVELTAREPRTSLLSLYLVGLVVVLHATVPLLTAVPEYGWVYKHVGVIETFLTYGRVVNPNDIYQAWPGMFAAAAGLSSVSGVSPLQLARWAPVFFDLLDGLMLLAIFRVLTRSTRISFLAVALFEGGVAWVAQDYLSPQAFAYVLWLGFVLILARWLLVVPVVELPLRGLAPIRRLREYARRGASFPSASSAATRRVCAIAALAIYGVVVFSHQLTPYVGLGALVTLAVLDVVRPRWLTVAAGLLAIAYLIPNYAVVKPYGLFSGFDILQNASGPVRSAASNGQVFTALVDRVLYLGMAFGAVAAVLRSWRTPGRVLLAAVLGFTPVLLLAGQAYGGEAVIRVFLFAVPWFALLIATEIVSVPVRAARDLLTVLVLAVVVLLGMQGLFGPISYLIFTPAELRASEWLYANLPRRSLVLTPSPNFPLLESANPRDIATYPMPDDSQAPPVLVDSRKISSVNAWVATHARPNTYLVLSHGLFAYSQFLSSPPLGALSAALPHSPSWRRFYANGDVVVYRYLGPRGAQATRRRAATPRRQPFATRP